MDRRIISKITYWVIGSLLVWQLTACSGDDSSSTPSKDIDTNPAMNNPDKFAWQLFIELSKPINPAKPDSSVIWEGWALAQNVFEYPNKQPIWEEVAMQHKDFKDLKGIPLQQLSIEPVIQQDDILEFDPSEPSQRMGGLNETRFNKVVFDFIVDNDLYYQEGIESFITKSKVIDLPIQAREVKAVWDTIEADMATDYHYVIEKDSSGNEIYWGLVALHIITKDIPQWTWATFEHKNNPGLKSVDDFEYLKTRDSYGLKNGQISDSLAADFEQHNMPPKWRNYILRGTQINFTTLTGVPTILANTYTENRFLHTSSCISCHARATLGSSLSFDELPENVKDTIVFGKIPANIEAAKNYFNSLGFVKQELDVPDPITKESVIMYTGFPKPDWFDTTYQTTGRKDTYTQLDFMWSFFRAKRRNPYMEQ